MLAESYPRLAGSSEPGGAETSNRKTFAFGPLKPGKTTEAVWKLSAVKAGHFTLLYGIGAGLSGDAKAETAGGVAPGGPSPPKITGPPDTEVTDSGEVVEIGEDDAGQGRIGLAGRASSVVLAALLALVRCRPAARPSSPRSRRSRGEAAAASA